MISYYLPDILERCPIEGGTNPHYERCAAESRAWVDGFNVFRDRKRAFFKLGSIELLASHVYHYAGAEEFRTCCDFCNLLFVFDEFSDDQTGKDALETGQVFHNAMKDAHWDDHSKFSRITKEFRQRFMRRSGPRGTGRFLKHWGTYCAAVIREAELRERDEILDLEEFIGFRRENSGVQLTYDLIEYVLGIDLPHEVYEDATFMDIYWAAVDLICWSNDVYSYDNEQSKRIAGNNVVTVLMRNRNMSLQQASDYVGEYCRTLMDRFTSSQARLPSWGPSVDRDVRLFIQGLGAWVRGNLDWSFESQRYFGSAHNEVRATRLVVLRPQEPIEECGCDSDSE